MKSLVLLIFSFFIPHLFHSQGFALETGYKYSNYNNLELALQYRISDYYSENPFQIATFLRTNFNKKPEVGFGVHQRFKQVFEVGTNFSKNTIEPTLGFNLLNVLKLNLGYPISTTHQKWDLPLDCVLH